MVPIGPEDPPRCGLPPGACGSWPLRLSGLSVSDGEDLDALLSPLSYGIKRPSARESVSSSGASPERGGAQS